jgi:hypothetical protein
MKIRQAIRTAFRLSHSAKKLSKSITILPDGAIVVGADALASEFRSVSLLFTCFSERDFS